jgi:hypothetical protein
LIKLVEGYEKSLETDVGETLARYRLKGTVKLWCRDVWPFKNLVPEAANEIRLFPSYEAAVTLYLKNLYNKYAFSFDRLLGKVILILKKDPTAPPGLPTEITVNDIQAALLLFIGNSTTAV